MSSSISDVPAARRVNRHLVGDNNLAQFSLLADALGVPDGATSMRLHIDWNGDRVGKLDYMLDGQEGQLSIEESVMDALADALLGVDGDAVGFKLRCEFGQLPTIEITYFVMAEASMRCIAALEAAK